MDTLSRYRKTIEEILEEYANVPYAYGDIKTEVVFDRSRDRYLLVNVGWEDDARVHGALVHIDIIDGKVWIQRDGTEDGMATDFLRAGIPREQIVLGFHAPRVRQHTEFAVA